MTVPKPAASLPAFPSNEIQSYVLDGLTIGEHAHAGALRFFATGSLDGEPMGDAIARRYLESALRVAFATRRLLRSIQFSSAVFTHGIYVPWGIVGEVARQEGVHVSTWNVAYRKRRFIFSHGDTYHHTLMSEPREHWENLELSDKQERDLMHYLSSRRDGLFDWIVFHRPKADDPKELPSLLGLDPSKPVIGLLTNVSWDAQLHYPANAFASMLDWLVQTCRYFETRPDLQLLIRVHPAEISGFPPSRQPVLGELRKAIPQLPANIIVVPPESELSTYALMSLCNSVIIYGTKTGVELTSRGIPVIVAGEAWIRNKGLTCDASSPEEYFRILDGLPFPAGLDAGDDGSRPPLCVSLLLQPHDSAGLHRAARREFDLSLEAEQRASSSSRSSPRDWIPSATEFSGGRRSSSTRARRRVLPSWWVHDRCPTSNSQLPIADSVRTGQPWEFGSWELGVEFSPTVTAPLSLLVATLTALVAGAAVRRLASVHGAVVPPRPDRWHSAPTPTMGGIAIVAATVAGFAVGLAGPVLEGDLVEWLAVLLAGLAMFTVGLFDDRLQLSPVAKLVASLAVGAFLVFALAGVEPEGALPSSYTLIGTIWFAGLCHAFNLLDNMDGLAAGVALIATAFLAALLGPSLGAGLSILLLVAGGGARRVPLLEPAESAALHGRLRQPLHRRNPRRRLARSGVPRANRVRQPERAGGADSGGAALRHRVRARAAPARGTQRHARRH